MKVIYLDQFMLTYYREDVNMNYNKKYKTLTVHRQYIYTYMC